MADTPPPIPIRKRAGGPGDGEGAATAPEGDVDGGEGTSLPVENTEDTAYLPVVLSSDAGEDLGPVSDLVDPQAVFLDGARKGAVSLVQSILEDETAGVDVHGTDISGWTALHLAAQFGHVEVVDVLLRAGADVGAVHEGSGDTPLHNAAWKNHPAVIRLLLDAGADRYATNAVGNRPIEMVRNKEGSPETWAMLQEQINPTWYGMDAEGGGEVVDLDGDGDDGSDGDNGSDDDDGYDTD